MAKKNKERDDRIINNHYKMKIHAELLKKVETVY